MFYRGEGSGGGLAFDKSGNLYTVSGVDKIVKVTPDGKHTTFASGLKNATGPHCRFPGQCLLHGISGQDRICLQVTPAGTRSTVESGLTWPYSLSSDANSNIYLFVLGQRS